MRAFLPDETRITTAHLRTGDLKPALGFYVGLLGFRAIEQHQGEVKLGTTERSPALIVLSETPGALPRPARATGLYHLAIRYPSRLDLANALAKLAQHRYPIAGASDHLVSEAIYLSDPEGNGIELYADRSRSRWLWRNGQIVMATEPLDMENLLASGEGQSLGGHIAPLADLGHIHLHVADLAAAERFYHEFLGLAVTNRSYPGALFFSAGGYHHHLAVNTWAGDLTPPSNTAGLVSYRMTVAEAEILYCLRHRAPLAGYEVRTLAGEDGSELLQIRDPNGNWLEVRAAQSPPSAGTPTRSKQRQQVF